MDPWDRYTLIVVSLGIISAAILLSFAELKEAAAEPKPEDCKVWKLSSDFFAEKSMRLQRKLNRLEEENRFLRIQAGRWQS